MLKKLTTMDQLEKILGGEAAVIFKHSTRCPISSFALSEVEQFQTENPEVSVYRLDVVEHRALSTRVAESWDVRHESPQVLIVNGSRLNWSGSHFEVSHKNLAVRK